MQLAFSHSSKLVVHSRMRLSLLNCTVLAGCLSLFLPWASSMICYKCTILPAQYFGEKDQPCSKFDAGPNFYQECPQSTFCLKRIIHYRLSNGSIVSAFERDCAPQKNISQHYSDNDRQWHSREKVVENAYTDGCFKGENRGAPNGPSEYCYCSSNYCNNAVLTHSNLVFIITLVSTTILLINNYF